MMDCIFWGRFDPPTVAHLRIINDISSIFAHVHLVLIDDPSKLSPVEPIVRISWLKNCLQDIYNITYYLQDRFNVYSYDRVKKSCKNKLAVVCGDDAFLSWLDSKNKSSVIDSYDLIYMISRREMITNKKNNIVISYLPEYYRSISSQQIKESVRLGEELTGKIHKNILADVISAYNK